MVKIPTRLEDLLPTATLEKLMEVLHQPDISNTVREAFHRVGLKDTNPLGQVQDAWKQARGWLETLSQASGAAVGTSTTINATGQLVLPGFETLPIASSAAFAFAQSAVSYQSVHAIRQHAKEFARRTFNRSAVWLNSPLAALQLLHRPGLTVAIARADAVRVPAFGDVRAMLTSMGSHVVEVGAANGATEQDWAKALTGEQQLLLLVSPNSLPRDSATAQRAFAIQAAQRGGATVVDLLIDGCVNAELSERCGFPEANQRFSAGSDLVLLPLNVFVGAPAGMLVIGRDSLVEHYHANADSLGIQCSAPLLASALKALDGDVESSVLRRLLANPENLKDRCGRMAIQLNDTETLLSAIAVERSTALGPTPWDRYQLHNWAVRITPRENTPAAAKRLLERLYNGEGGSLPIACVQTASDLLLDLRFVGPEDDHQIVSAFLGGKTAAQT